jgi:hypothetical protein
MDDTDSAIFVLFDRDATLLLNKTCASVLEGVCDFKYLLKSNIILEYHFMYYCPFR